MVGKVGVSIEGERRSAFGAMISMQLEMLAHHMIHQNSWIIVVEKLQNTGLLIRTNFTKQVFEHDFMYVISFTCMLCHYPRNLMISCGQLRLLASFAYCSFSSSDKDVLRTRIESFFYVSYISSFFWPK